MEYYSHALIIKSSLLAHDREKVKKKNPVYLHALICLELSLCFYPVLLGCFNEQDADADKRK